MQNIKPTDLADQEHYICHCKKPFRYNCQELSSCLLFMNKMMSLFLGANSMPSFTQQNLQNIYFKMMPIEWQHSFINNGQDIASPNYVGTRKWADVVKGSSGPTNDHNYVGTIPINNKYTTSQNTGLKVDRRTTLE